MKNLIITAISLLFIFTSCTTETCKVCKQNLYDSTNKFIKTSEEKEACDDELTNLENEEEVVINKETYKWECN